MLAQALRMLWLMRRADLGLANCERGGRPGALYRRLQALRWWSAHGSGRGRGEERRRRWTSRGSRLVVTGENDGFTSGRSREALSACGRP